jgi:NAD+ diphosphatase
MREPNTFTGAELDRAADGRRTDAAWVNEQLSHEQARAVVAADSGVRVRGDRLELVLLREAPAPAGDAVPVLLGLDEDGPLFAVDEGPAPKPGTRPVLVGAGGRRGEPGPEDGSHLGLRDAAQSLGQAEGGLAAYASAMLNWHRSHSFCPNCGSGTDVAEAGLVRRCPVCGVSHHPRIDPVVIMLVTGEDRLLLGRQRIWPPRRYSALAGFVSPGESLEEAVAREVLEEAGVQVGRPAYESSQPWPFPVSLMLGFTVPWAGGEVGGADAELEDVRWFSREEVAGAAGEDSWATSDEDADSLLLPPRSAIARRLIEGWLRLGEDEAQV